MARTRKSGRIRRNAGARLHFELLEDRRLLAAQYGFAVNLYEDAGGAPGALIADDTIPVGREFFLEITAEDLRTEALGLASMAVDVIWDPKVFREIDEPFNPSNPETSLVTDAFPLARRGELDNEVGWIHKLRGGAFLSTNTGRPIGVDGPERFALLHFQAIAQADDSAIRIRSSGGVGFIPWRPYTQDDLSFELQTVTVVPELPGDLNTVQHATAAGGESEPSSLADGQPTAVWQNTENPVDVNGRDGVTPIDALIAINYINAHLDDATLPDVQVLPPPFYDVNGDGRCTSHDVLLVINALDSVETPEGEGEAGSVASPAPIAEPESHVASTASFGVMEATHATTMEPVAAGWAGDFSAPASSAAEDASDLPESAVPAAWPAGQNSQGEGTTRPSTGVAAVFRSSLEWTPPAVEIEDILDVLSGAWAADAESMK